MNALETQVGGDHYKSMPIQPMEFSMANGLDACQHTIVKYVTRFRQKGGVQDLEKARHVIDMLIEFERKASAKTAANDNAAPSYVAAKRGAIHSGACKAKRVGNLCDDCSNTTDGTCRALQEPAKRSDA